MRNFKYSIIASIILSVSLAACGGDSGTSPSDVIPDSVPGSPSSSSVKKASSSSVIQSSSSVIQSGDSHEGSSNSKQSSSSSSKVSSSSKRSDGSCSSKQSSSSVIPASSGNLPSSSSKKVESSNSEYIPFDHSRCLGDSWNFSDDFYKKFTDTRNGRSYYYYTAVSSKTGKTVTVMAENLNVGEMVLGENDQNDDDKIERYCYNNDTTKCDINGGLYQWAEMMQLPSRCNTESCSDLIQENHRGICPEGWRLMKWKDFYIAWHAASNNHGIEGVRSSYGFNGYNSTGLSLTGAGLRTAEGKFSGLYEKIAFFRPEEYEDDKNIRAHHSLISAQDDSAPQKNHRELKTKGFSVRCVKIE